MKPAELTRRLGDVDWLLSQVRDGCLSMHYRWLASSEFAQWYRQVAPFTMSGPSRLAGLYDAVRSVARRNIPGDVVECGSARGGSAALMGLALKRYAPDRRVWLFDTFAGIPPPTRDDPDVEIARLYTGSFRGELAEVQKLFVDLDLGDRASFVKGLFQETVPGSPVGAIAVLHLDGDWYDSVKVCLDHLYDRVTPGGVVQVDDYGHWEGARKAVDEFLAARALRVRLTRLDYTGRQFIKP
jgi:predicted O-methyltransferase YrrM